MNAHWRRTAMVGLAAGLLLVPIAAWGGRFGGGGGARGGGGGFRGGGGGGGGFRGGAPSGGFRGGGGARPGGYGGAPMSRPQPRPQMSSAGRSSPRSTGSVHGPYGAGAGPATRPGQGGAGQRQVSTGPRGGTYAGGGSQRSFSGPGGGSYSGGSNRGVYTGPRGAVAVGGGRGGSYTGPGGNTYSAGRAGGVVIGPNGNVHAGGARGASVVTPGGAAAAGSRGSVTAGPRGVTASGARGGVAAGPGGVVAGGSRAGVVAGPGGVVAGGSRGGVAAGPGGVVAGGSRAGVAAGPGGVVAGGSRAGFAAGQSGVVAGGGRAAAAVGPYGAVGAANRAAWGLGPAGGFAGTRYVSAASLHAQGAAVRGGFGYYNAFRPGWYGRYPGAWFAAGWAAGTAWNALPWAGYAPYVGYAADTQPIYYDYGNTVTYQGGQVYYDDQPYAAEADYAQQAVQIADAGRQAQPPPDDSWQPLGVFAMVQGDETTSNDIFQLAINKAGIVRGNYYNAVSDSTQPVSGALDKTSQRLAWTIGDRKEPVYETGLYNLTQEETALLVHFSKDRTEQYKLFRVEQPADSQAAPTQ